MQQKRTSTHSVCGTCHRAACSCNEPQPMTPPQLSAVPCQRKERRSNLALSPLPGALSTPFALSSTPDPNPQSTQLLMQRLLLAYPSPASQSASTTHHQRKIAPAPVTTPLRHQLASVPAPAGASAPAHATTGTVRSTVRPVASTDSVPLSIRLSARAHASATAHTQTTVQAQAADRISSKEPSQPTTPSAQKRTTTTVQNATTHTPYTPGIARVRARTRLSCARSHETGSSTHTPEKNNSGGERGERREKGSSLSHSMLRVGHQPHVSPHNVSVSLYHLFDFDYSYYM